MRAGVVVGGGGVVVGALTREGGPASGWGGGGWMGTDTDLGEAEGLGGLVGVGGGDRDLEHVPAAAAAATGADGQVRPPSKGPPPYAPRLAGGLGTTAGASSKALWG